MPNIIRRQAERFEALHADKKNKSRWNQGVLDDRHYIGMCGEHALGEFLSVYPDTTLRPNGDGGIDSRAPLLFTFDVKTSPVENCRSLLCGVGKVVADIYVLAEYEHETEIATLVGWCWGAELRAAPVKDFGYENPSHALDRDNLRDMSELEPRVLRYR